MTDYFLDNETNTAIDLPSTYYLRQEGWLLVHYVLSDGTELQGRYGYDTWKVEDFAATEIPLLGVAGTPAAATAIYLGAGYQNLSLIHISEPTRLLSSSYAALCLKKKK